MIIERIKFRTQPQGRSSMYIWIIVNKLNPIDKLECMQLEEVTNNLLQKVLKFLFLRN